MKKLLGILLLFSLGNIASCQNSATKQEQMTNNSKTVKETITVDDFEKKLGVLNIQLVDVRTPGEYEGGHLNNAKNINFKSDNFTEQISKLDKTKPVMVYCLSGGRSAAAAKQMQDMGFVEIYNMDGGIMKWRNSGKPLVQGVAAVQKAGLSMDVFNKMVSQNKYVLVDYNATWCAPCKKMMPVLESLAEKKKDKLTLLKIDADENKDLLTNKGIAGIPFLELYENGKLVWKHEGFIEEVDLLKETKL